MDGMFPGPHQSFQRQHRPMDDCSPGGGEMAQDGRARGGTFLGEMDRCRESTGRTTERIAQNKRARAGSLAIV